MARPFYESQKDRDAETAVAALIADKWGGVLHKLAPKYGADFAHYVRGKLTNFVEVKDRSERFTSDAFERYGFYAISLHKVTQMLAQAATAAARCVLVVKCQDGLFYAPIDRETAPLGGTVHGGRKDRGDWQDMEPMVQIPWSHFKEVV